MTQRASRVVPSGLFYSYSNSTSAGRSNRADGRRHAVRGVVPQRILMPLGMTNRRSIPARWPRPRRRPATGTRGGSYHVVPADGFGDRAAGQRQRTGADMARVMLCELRAGGWTDLGSSVRVGTAHDIAPVRQVASLPVPARLRGDALVNRRPMEQAGDLNGFASLVFLLPEDGLGIFVAVTATRAVPGPASSGTSWPLLPGRGPALRRPAAIRALHRPDAVRGTYRTLRMAHATLDKWRRSAQAPT